MKRPPALQPPVNREALEHAHSACLLAIIEIGVAVVGGEIPLAIIISIWILLRDVGFPLFLDARTEIARIEANHDDTEGH